MLDFKRVMIKFAAIVLAFFCYSTVLFGQATKMRPINELVVKNGAAWTDFLQQAIKEATNHVEVLPKDNIRADSALYKCQVTTRSTMGAIVYETGGLLIGRVIY
jgi:Protein of unknown function DUF2625